MKNILLILVFSPILALNAVAQDSAWTDLALGDRVEITFHSGATIGGTLVAPRGITPAPVESIDYAQASALTLDVTWEYPGLNGTLTVPKKEIKSVRKMRVLDEKTRRNLAEVKKQISAENSKPALTKAPEPLLTVEPPTPAAPPIDDAARKAEEELKKAREMFAKFPTPDWSPERHNAIRLKQLRGQALTAAEREFNEGFSLWEKGRADAGKKPAEPRKE